MDLLTYSMVNIISSGSRKSKMSTCLMSGYRLKDLVGFAELKVDEETMLERAVTERKLEKARTSSSPLFLYCSFFITRWSNEHC